MNTDKRKYPPLFAGAKDWQNNACISFPAERLELYTQGYKQAADTLVETVITTTSHQDLLVYPILFLYRHYLELRLKGIISDGKRLLDDDNGFPEHHRLIDLWSIVKGVTRKVWQSNDPPEFEYIDHILSELSELDSGSMTFRYPIDKQGHNALKNITYINIRQAAEMIEEAAEFLDSVRMNLTTFIDYQNDRK